MSAPLLSRRDLRGGGGGLSLSFTADATVIDALDLDLRGGEFLCLLGPSGCGKSTLLRLISGLETPDSGEIDWSVARRTEIGFVFQEPNLMPWPMSPPMSLCPWSLPALAGARLLPS